MDRIAIAIHGGENVDFGAYGNHLSMMAVASQKHNLALVTTRGVRIAQARNCLVEKVKEMDCRFVVFIDTDHIVPLDMIDLLLENMDNCSCVSGLVCRRRDTMDQIGFNIRDGKFHKLTITPRKGVYNVDVCAFGCTMINMEVFNELERPWFGNEPRISHKGKSYTMRSDVLFCERLRERGKKIMIDSRVVVGHIGQPVVVWPSNCDQLRDLADKGVLGQLYERKET